MRHATRWLDVAPAAALYALAALAGASCPAAGADAVGPAAGADAVGQAEAVRRAVDDSAVAIFAFRDRRGRPLAWPITPYRDGDVIAVTSTLAYIHKAEHVRRDGRVALLVGGWHVSGRARVHADVSGDEFVRRFQEQELRKFPPARAILRVPFHRYLFSWYFGRAYMEFAPVAMRGMPGSDAATLITLDGEGFPVITPIPSPPLAVPRFPLLLPCPDGPAAILLHLEPTMDDLRQVLLRGRVRAGEFVVHRRRGSLEPPAPRGWVAELRRQIAFHREARNARRIIDGWQLGVP